MAFKMRYCPMAPKPMFLFSNETCYVFFLDNFAMTRDA